MSEETIDRRLLMEMVGEFPPGHDAEKVIDYLVEFLNEVAGGKPPRWIMPEVEAAAASYVLLEDLAREHPILIKTKIHGDLGVPGKMAEVFTWGLFFGVYLTSRGVARWPTKKKLNS